MSQIKRLLMVDDSIRDMAARLAVTLRTAQPPIQL